MNIKQKSLLFLSRLVPIKIPAGKSTTVADTIPDPSGPNIKLGRLSVKYRLNNKVLIFVGTTRSDTGLVEYEFIDNETSTKFKVSETVFKLLFCKIQVVN